jgi:hypothetical protein
MSVSVMDPNRLDGPGPVAKRERGGVRPAVVAGGGILLVLGVAMWLDTSALEIPRDIRIGRIFGAIMLIAIGTALLNGRAFVHVRSGRGGDERARRVPARSRGTAGVWLIGIGAWMIASQTHLFGLTYGNSWPLFIVLTGIVMVIRGAR